MLLCPSWIDSEIPRQRGPQLTARQIDPPEGVHTGRARTGLRSRAARVAAAYEVGLQLTRLNAARTGGNHQVCSGGAHPRGQKRGSAKVIARWRGTGISKSQRIPSAELEAEAPLGVGIGFRTTLAPAVPHDRDGLPRRSAICQHDLAGKKNWALDLRLIKTRLLLAHTAEKILLLPGIRAGPSRCWAGRLPPRGTTRIPWRPSLLAVTRIRRLPATSLWQDSFSCA